MQGFRVELDGVSAAMQVCVLLLVLSLFDVDHAPTVDMLTSQECSRTLDRRRALGLHHTSGCQARIRHQGYVSCTAVLCCAN